MLLVKVKAPEGSDAEVARLAFSVGLSEASVHQEYVHGPDRRRDVIEVQASTPTAKALIEAVMASPRFDPLEWSISVREPRSIVSNVGPAAITRPLVVPAIDLLEELWQFSHVTFGFVGRVAIAAMILAYGMIAANLLLMIAGLLFLPLLPVLLAIGFGLWTREWRLAGQGVLALVVGVALVIGGAAGVALMAEPPLRFAQFSPPLVSVLVSAAVGIAAGLGSADDAGRRELIGLAATAQVVLLPAWLGISLVFGFPADVSVPRRIATFGLIVATIVAAALGTYAVIGVRARAVRSCAEPTAP
jgi:hypothetical protein